MTITTERPTNPLRRGVHRPAPRHPRVTGREVAAAAALVAVLAVGSRWTDAERASDAGVSGSVMDLMLGHRVHHESPWDFTGPGGPVTCYSDTTGFGTPGEQCDTDAAQPGIQLPGDAPLTRLKPGAACPADVPQWATCDGGRP